IGIRGGLQKKPLSFASANTFAAPMLNHLSVNSTFTFIKSMGLEKLPRFRYFTDTQEILSLLNGAQGEAVVMQRHPQANVVLIILESFSTEYTGVHADGKSWTPFLDSLAKKSLYFKKSFANGRRSIEGVGALLSGVPALMSEPFITSPFMTNSFVGLGSILDQQGYHTSFFHGGQNGTMYFDSFSKSAGIQNYFGLNEYPNKSDFDGVWGIWDRPFLQYMVSQLNQFPAPFFSTVFTLSSHQPFKVPENEKHKFTEGPVEILKSVAYADDALKDFFTEASKQVWFKNTLFVITADHTSMHFRENYKNLLGDYLVPLLFYFPGQDWAKVNTDQLVQQIDVMPSIIDFLDLKVQSRNYLGRSVFSNKKSHIAVFTDQDYVLFADGHRLQVNASDLVNNSNPPYQVQTFQWPWMQKVKIDTRPESSSILLQQDLQKHLQAQLQYFSDGLWDHRLYYPVGQ
ncbi:MAG: LTA synthase family protein, partial [Pseudobdellovibrionaceae bacterium]